MQNNSLYDDEIMGEDGPRTTLISRNITVMGRRTSVRLEPEMWTALREIARREQCSIHDICTLICVRKNLRTSLTAAIRVFLMLYYRAAATEDGHKKSGHGDFEFMKRRARISTDAAGMFSKRRQEYPISTEANFSNQNQSAEERIF